MKYKYLKGNEKDFDGAPEGALYVLSCIGENYYSVDMVHTLCGLDISDSDHEYIIAERQPITEPSWDGVGLPPVGCECEFFDCEKWFRVTMMFSGSQLVVLYDHNNQVERSFSASRINGKFRPLRSEVDRKRDEFISYLHCDESLGMHSLFKSTAEAIYDLIAAGKIPGVKLED